MRRLKMLALVTTVAMAMMIVSACVTQSNPYQAEIGGQKTTFRANLGEAAKVPIGNISAIQNLLFSSSVETIYVAYVPDNRSNGFYTVTGYELAYKMVAIQNTLYGSSPKVEGLMLNKTEEAYNITSVRTPVILMKAGSNRTGVSFDRNLVVVEGMDMTEDGRDYTDLDLAADRLLLTLMKV